MRTKIQNPRKERGDITMNTTEIKSSNKDVIEILYSNKLNNLEKMDNF
jgi:hypothetical protein